LEIAELCCDWLKDVVKMCDCKTAQERTNKRRTLTLNRKTVRCDEQKADIPCSWLKSHHQVHTSNSIQSYVVMGCMVVRLTVQLKESKWLQLMACVTSSSAHSMTNYRTAEIAELCCDCLYDRMIVRQCN
jgi:hypothetical protein